jgi:hypothetical protein
MWLYQDRKIQSLEDFPENTYGFIYEVTHLPTQRKYIGKKVLYFNRTLAPLKGEKKKRKVVKESDWMEYYGSHPEIKKILKEEGKQNFTREILILVPSKKLLTYYECKYLFQKGVIEPDSIYINDNILAKFYRKDFLK